MHWEEKGIIGKAGVLKMAKNKKEEIASKWSEDWVPLKNIMNGMIQLENGEYVTGVKIAPKNIFILDAGTRDNVIYQLRNFYNSINFEFWLVVADRPVDINVYLSQLQIQFNRANNAITRKLVQEDINKANMFMSAEYNVVDTEYYILFKEKNLDMIQKRLRTIITGLANCGLDSAQTSNEDLRVILDNFLNGGMNTEFGTVKG